MDILYIQPWTTKLYLYINIKVEITLYTITDSYKS